MQCSRTVNYNHTPRVMSWIYCLLLIDCCRCSGSEWLINFIAWWFTTRGLNNVFLTQSAEFLSFVVVKLEKLALDLNIHVFWFLLWAWKLMPYALMAFSCLLGSPLNIQDDKSYYEIIEVWSTSMKIWLTGGGIHHRLHEWQCEWGYERSSSPQSQFYKTTPTPTLKVLSNFADDKHLLHCTGEALNHWYKHIYITMQTQARTTGRVFSNPRGGARGQGHREKAALYGETCVFTFMIFHISFPFLSMWYHWENSHFSIKGLWKPNK